jgi:hypothetical protein
MAAPVGQNNWRFCNKCYALWWNGYPDNGKCAAGGEHAAEGFGKGGSWDIILVADPVPYPGTE